MRRWLSSPIEQLHEFVELREHGLLVVDVLHDGDAAPSFRTLVQTDGDVLSSITAAALTDPDFATAHTRHLEHVGQRLRAPTDRLRIWSVRLSMLVSSTGAVVFGVLVHVIGLVTHTASSSWHELAVLVGSALGGALGWPLGRRLLWWLVRRLLEQFGNGENPIGPALDRLDRIGTK